MIIFLVSHFIVFNWHRKIRSALDMFYVFDHLIIMTDWQSALVELLGNNQLLKIQQRQRLILRSNKNYSRQNCLQTRFLPAIRNLKLFGWSLTSWIPQCNCDWNMCCMRFCSLTYTSVYFVHVKRLNTKFFKNTRWKFCCILLLKKGKVRFPWISNNPLYKLQNFRRIQWRFGRSQQPHNSNKRRCNLRQLAP